MDLLLLILSLSLSCCMLKAFLSFANRSCDPSMSGNLPPGPKPLPIIGNILDLGFLPHRSLAKLAQVHGPIMSLRLGCLTVVVASSAPLAREILQTHAATFASRFLPDSLRPFSYGELGMPWFGPIGPLWRSLRQIFTAQLFSPVALDLNRHLRRRKIQELLDHVRKCGEMGSCVDVGNAIFTTLLNLMANTMFSVDLADPTSELAKEIKVTISHILVESGKPNIADFYPVFKRIDPQGAKRRMTRYVGKIFGILDMIVKERRQAREVSGFIRKNDMLDILLDLTEDENEDMNEFHIKHIFLDLISAGTDTTSTTAEWAIAELLRNPEKLSKLQDELKQVIGWGNPVEESDVARLPYLQATVKETFRMHPAGAFIPRKAEDTVQVGGYTVKEGAQVLINAWAIGRDPALWKDPDQFMPERFLGLNIDVKGQHFELIPFGGGRRQCPGMPLATRMLHTMLGSLINLCDWKLEDGVTPETLDMGEKFGTALRKLQPLRAMPLLHNHR